MRSTFAPLLSTRVALDRGRAVRAGEVDGPRQQVVRDALSTVARPHPDAPHRPDVEIVDVRDLPVAGEARVGTRVHRGPADHLIAVVGEHAGRRSLPDQLLHPLAPGGADQALGSPSRRSGGSSGTNTRSRRAAWARPWSSRRRTPWPVVLRSPCRNSARCGADREQIGPELSLGPGHGGGGAGGNRTLVREVRDVRATTIPDLRLTAAETSGPHDRRVFPRCQRSFPPPAVSPCGPPLLLLPGCSGQAPRALTGRCDSLPTD